MRLADIYQNLIAKAHATRKLEGRMDFRGLKVSIENALGSVRRGVDPDGHEWSTRMLYPYGYVRGTEGADGDHVDVFVGDHEDAPFIYVVHLNNPETGEYDEDKAFLGFQSRADALEAFRQHYDNADRILRSVSTLRFEKFKARVLNKEHHGKRVSR
jgi:hypothetical protein